MPEREQRSVPGARDGRPDSEATLHEAELASFLFGKLDPVQRQAFLDHLSDCPSCAHELEELRSVPALLAQAGSSVSPPSDLEARVFAAIAAEPEAEPGPAAPASKASGHDRSWWRRWQRRWLPGVAVATAVAMVLVVLVVGRFGGPGSRPLPQTIQLVSASGVSAGGTAVLHPTATGTTVDLTVHGLGVPPPGHVYVCWLVGAGDSAQHQNRVSVGSFTVPGSGDAALHWDTAADISEYHVLGVTLEPSNGNPLRQGPKVLVMA